MKDFEIRTLPDGPQKDRVLARVREQVAHLHGLDLALLMPPRPPQPPHCVHANTYVDPAGVECCLDCGRDD